MSQYFNPRRTRNIYDPRSSTPFRISRSKIDLFIECPRCFYLDRRLGRARPPGFPFSLNSAVDALLKKEFDMHRLHKTSHPLMVQYGVDAVPFEHPRMNEWRDSLRAGVTFLHTSTNLEITGGVDDVWINPVGELLVVDYKATSKNGEVGLDAEWQGGYKRQMEIYQWLFRKNGFRVHSTGYFVYCNGRSDAEAFDGKLEFDVKVIPYTGDDSWIDETIVNLHRCLSLDTLPRSDSSCDYCGYREAVSEVERRVDFLASHSTSSSTSSREEPALKKKKTTLKKLNTKTLF